LGSTLFAKRVEVSALNTLGSKVYFLDEVDSTNSYAQRLAADGEPEGSVVVADYQSAGRGRQGRVWSSVRGKNVCMSVILRPEIPPREVQIVTLGAGVALARAVRGLYGLDARLKWPNDLMISGKKAAGILTEMSSAGDTVRHVVLGIGINVNSASGDFPPDIRGASTSIMLETGRKVDRDELTGRFMEELGHLYSLLLDGGKARILDEWRAGSCTLGRTVSMMTSSGRIKGKAADVDEYGRLVVELEGGKQEKLTSGDLDGTA
jgi:BirA family biotin operon repressor/biotin-[acetyl-CoA-carboxylase] ligase